MINSSNSEDPLHGIYAATCTSVVVSGIGDLDGTYTDAPNSTWDYYALRLGGTDLFEVYRYGDTWYISNGDNTLQYATSDPALHPVDITLEWAECSGYRCDDGAALLQPVITCADDASEPTPSTCTSLTVSGAGDLDGTFTDAPSSTWDYYAQRLGGTDIFKIYRHGIQWYIDNGDNTLQYMTYDPALHPADITLEWVECSKFRCGNEAALLQPVILCEGDTVAPTPSPNTSPSPSPTMVVEKPYGDTITLTPFPNTSPSPSPTKSYGDTKAPTPSPNTSPSPSPTKSYATEPTSSSVDSPTSPSGAPAEEETPAPSPSPITGNGIEDEGGDEGISIGAIVGIVAGVLAILGGSGLLLKCGCKEINFNCFNRH